MPIYPWDVQEILKRVEENAPISVGQYLVQIEDITVKQTADGRRIQWELGLQDSDRTLVHMHWIDMPDGVERLILDLDNLDIEYEKRSIPAALNSLIGSFIRIYVRSTEGGRTTIYFLEKI